MTGVTIKLSMKAILLGGGGGEGGGCSKCVCFFTHFPKTASPSSPFVLMLLMTFPKNEAYMTNGCLNQDASML